MPTEILTLECDTDSLIFSSQDEVKFDSLSWFSQPSTDNLITAEVPLSWKHWFNLHRVSSFQAKPVFSTDPSVFPNLRIETNAQSLWNRTLFFSEQFFEIEKMSSTSLQIPHEIALIADESALNLLSAEGALVPYATQLLHSAQSQISLLNLSANCSLTIFTDPESEGTKNLVLEIKISNKTYTEILGIWDEVATELLSNLPIEIQKNITVVFGEA